MIYTPGSVWSASGQVEQSLAYRTHTSKTQLTNKTILALFLCSSLSLMLAFGWREYSKNSVPLASITSSELSAQPSGPTILPFKTPDAEPEKVSDTISPALQALLEQWQKTHPERKWSVAVNGLENISFQASLDSETAFHPASIYKLFLSFSLFKEETLETLKSQSTLLECVNLMLKVSDEPCGDTIGKYIGWSKTDQLLKEQGLNHTKLDRSEGPISTASDTAKLVKGLYDGSLYSPSVRQYVLDILKQQTRRQGIPAGCSGCMVYNKTGDLGDVRHDAAIIETGKVKYVLVIFTDGASYSQIAELTKQINDTINNLGAQP